MNWRRGLFRFWAAASLIWILGWFYYVWSTCGPLPHPFSDKGQVCYTTLDDAVNGVMTLQPLDLRHYANIIAMGVVPPAAVLILGLIGLWIIHGFRKPT